MSLRSGRPPTLGTTRSRGATSSTPEAAWARCREAARWPAMASRTQGDCAGARTAAAAGPPILSAAVLRPLLPTRQATPVPPRIRSTPNTPLQSPTLLYCAQFSRPLPDFMQRIVLSICNLRSVPCTFSPSHQPEGLLEALTGCSSERHPATRADRQVEGERQAMRRAARHVQPGQDQKK